jgi:hypothetical protein
MAQILDNPINLHDLMIYKDTGGDWEALYYKGKLVSQDHSIDLTEYLDVPTTDFSLGGNNINRFPTTIEQFKVIEAAALEIERERYIREIDKLNNRINELNVEISAKGKK